MSNRNIPASSNVPDSLDKTGKKTFKLQLCSTNEGQNNLVQNLIQHIKILSFTDIHKGVESPSEGMSFDNKQKKTDGDLTKEGNLNDPGQKDEKNGKR